MKNILKTGKKWQLVKNSIFVGFFVESLETKKYFHIDSFFEAVEKFKELEKEV